VGERDRVFPPSQARGTVDRLREGSLALISDCGHMPHVECPDRFLGALDGFLLKRVLR
jgi:pimeloyl-ACP methyl ester carboxylesterase